MDRFLKAIGFAGLMLILLGGLMFAAGWRMNFEQPLECSGIKTIQVGSARTFWEIATRDYPDTDPRPVVDELARLNGDILQAGGSIKAPESCR